MSAVLDRYHEATVKDVVLDAVEDSGFLAEEAIPGIIMAVWDLAQATSNPSKALDEASDLLADGPRIEDDDEDT